MLNWIWTGLPTHGIPNLMFPSRFEAEDVYYACQILNLQWKFGGMHVMVDPRELRQLALDGYTAILPICGAAAKG
jgi:hypothetical protein